MDDIAPSARAILLTSRISIPLPAILGPVHECVNNSDVTEANRDLHGQNHYFSSLHDLHIFITHPLPC